MLLTQFLVFCINTIGVTLLIQVLSHPVRPLLKKIFTLMTVTILIWVDFAYLSRRTTDYEIATIYIRLAWTVTPILFSSVYAFILTYLGKQSNEVRLLTGLGITAVISIGIVFNSPVVIERIFYYNGEFTILYGAGVYGFFGIIILLTILSALSLTSALKTSNSPQLNKRLKIILAGMLFFFIMNTIYNIIYPVFFQNFSLYEWGDYSTLVLLAVVAYASIRHRFFDVQLLLTSSLISFVGCLLFFRGMILSPSFETAALSFALFLCYLPVGYFLMRYMNQAREQNKQLSVLTTQLQKQKDQYKQLAKEQEHIIDIIGHEMRSPLTTTLQTVHLYKELVLPYKTKLSQMLKTDPILSERIRIVYDAFSSIERSSKHALTLVNTMLETARIDSNMIHITNTEFDLTLLLKEIVDSYTHLMPSSVSIHFQHPYEPIIVFADKVKIEQALHELIRNGIKYGKRKTDDIPELSLSLTIEKKDVHISVQDKGRGIARSDIPHLGSKFTRLQNKKSAMPAPGGTGLGLYIIHNYMEKHGGKLLIESDGIGKGSRFTLVIPIEKQ